MQREADIQADEEKSILESLLPAKDEQEQAEFDLKAINLLMEVGLI
jgi:hypothetical protein